MILLLKLVHDQVACLLILILGIKDSSNIFVSDPSHCIPEVASQDHFLEGINPLLLLLVGALLLVEEVVVLLGADDPPEVDLLLVYGQPPVTVVEDDFHISGDDPRAGAFVQQRLTA